MWADRLARDGSCLQQGLEGGALEKNLSLQLPEVPWVSLPPAGRGVSSKGKRPEALPNSQYSTP